MWSDEGSESAEGGQSDGGGAVGGWEGIAQKVWYQRERERCVFRPFAIKGCRCVWYGGVVCGVAGERRGGAVLYA